MDMGLMLRTCSIPLLLTALVACSDSEDPTSAGTADCAIVIRIDDTQFIEHGLTKRAGESLGDADMSACDDTGANARGPYFPDDPKKVEAWSVPGFEVSDVVAISYNDHLYRVMVADDASKDIEAQVWEQFSKR